MAPIAPVGASSSKEKNALLGEKVASCQGEALAAKSARSSASSLTSATQSYLRDGPRALKGFCLIACGTAIVVSCFEIAGNLLDPFHIILCLYAAVFAFIGFCLEGTSLVCTRMFKWRIEHWMRILARVWGRGVFYLLIAGMQFAESGFAAFVAGTLLLMAAIASFGVSCYSSRKLNALHKALKRDYCSSKDEASLRKAFKRMDTDNSGYLEKEELAVVAKDLGLDIRPGEMVAIFDLLDADKNGKISFDEFKAWWSGQKEVDHAWV